MNQVASTSASESAVPYPIFKVAVDRIKANEQIRKNFDEEKLRQLGDSIKTSGLVQPVVVRTNGKFFDIVAGERRWRGAKMAGVTDIPVIVRDDLTDDGAAVLQALENLQREDLQLGETCAAVAALVGKLGFDETCAKLSKSPGWVSHHGRIGDLPIEVQKLVNDGKIESAEIAHMVGSLKTYGGDFKKTIDEFSRDEKWAKPPTREQLRERVKWAKQRFDEKEKEKAKLAKEKAKLAANPALKAKFDKEQTALRDKKMGQGERETRCKQLKHEAEQLEKQFTAELIRLTPGDYSKSKARDLPIEVRSRTYFSSYGNEPLPASAEAMVFGVDFDGPINVIAPVLNLIAPSAKLTLQLDDVTQEEARAIAKALSRPVNFSHYAHSTTVKKIRAALGQKPAKANAGDEQQGDLDVSKFIADCLDRTDSTAKAKAADVHAAYVAWTKRSKLSGLAFNDNRWGDAIAAAGIEKKRQKDGYQYLGVSIK